MSFKRRLTVLEAADVSENNSLNLKSPSMLWKTRVMMPAMLAAAATASIVRVSSLTITSQRDSGFSVS